MTREHRCVKGKPSTEQGLRRLHKQWNAIQEEELEVQLFYRTKRHVQLTEVGEIFLEEARQTLAQAARAREMAQKAGRGELGRLAIGFVGSAVSETLPLLSVRFRERFPDVELTLRELTTSQQIRALREGCISPLLFTSRWHWPGPKMLHHPHCRLF